MNNEDIESHVMLDTETLGLDYASDITSIAVIRFDPYNQDARRATILNCRTPHDGRIPPDPTTVAWRRQHEVDEHEAGLELFSWNLISDILRERLDPYTYVWALHPEFDLPRLSHYIGQPWNHKLVRDVATCMWLAEVEPHRNAAHIAFDDCLDQIDIVQEAFSVLYK